MKSVIRYFSIFTLIGCSGAAFNPDVIPTPGGDTVTTKDSGAETSSNADSTTNDSVVNDSNSVDDSNKNDSIVTTETEIGNVDSNVAETVSVESGIDSGNTEVSMDVAPEAPTKMCKYFAKDISARMDLDNFTYFDLNTSAFCVEMWMMSNHMTQKLLQMRNADTSISYEIETIWENQSKINCFLQWTATNKKIDQSNSQKYKVVGSLCDSKWHHIALCRSSYNDQSLLVSVDGGMFVDYRAAMPWSLGTINDWTTFIIGADDQNPSTLRPVYMDEVRLSSFDRYPNTGLRRFTPERHFVADIKTVFLYGMDEGSGSVLMDYSKNNLRARVDGGGWEEDTCTIK